MADPPGFKSNELTPEDLQVIRDFLETDDFATGSPDDDDQARARPAMSMLPGEAGQESEWGEGNEGSEGRDPGEDEGEDEMLAIFATEVDEDIAEMQQALGVLQLEYLGSQDVSVLPASALPALAALRRGAHKIRGTSAAMGCNAMSTIAHAIEALVDLARSRKIEPHTGLLALGHAVEALKTTLESVVTKGQESILPLLTLEENFTDMQLPLRNMGLDGEIEDGEPDEVGAPGEPRGLPGEAALTGVESRRLEQLVLHAGQMAEQQQEIDFARQQVETALADLHAAQARLRRIETFVASMPTMLTSPLVDTEQVVPSIEELAPSSLVARILREAAQRTGRAYQPDPLSARAAQSPFASTQALAESMLWDELELDLFTEEHVLARSLSEAIADVATATAQLQQALAHLDALVKQQAAHAGAIRDNLLALQPAAFPALASRSQHAIQMATRGLLLRAGEQQVIVPFSQVQRLDYSGHAQAGQVYLLNTLLDFRSNSPIPAMNEAGHISPVLILRDSTQSAPTEGSTSFSVSEGDPRVPAPPFTTPAPTAISPAVQVDEVLGEVELRVRPLPLALQRPGISGAAINRAGEVVLALDLPALIRQHQERERSAEVTAAPGDERDAEITQSTPYPAERVPRVLIVDDSVFMRRTLSLTLASQGYVLIEARDGIEALERLTSALPDVLLLDLEMPNLNGYELLNILDDRELLPDLKIILLTSRSSEKHRQRAQGLGIHAYLTKPCSEEALLSTVAGVLQRS